MRKGFWRWMVFMLGLAVCAGACAKVQAKTPGPAPALATPEPPARLVIPVPIDPPPVTSVPTETPTPATPTRPTTGRGAPPPTPTTTPTPTPTPEPTPPPVLQPGSNLAELEARAKERLDSAEKNLARVSRTALGTDAKAQYDSAQSFINLAKGAIKNKNFVYAHQCADRAATLASLLVK